MPLNFDAYLGWVNITDPNNIPEDARVISADDLLRYEKLGLDTAAKFAEVDSALQSLDADEVIASRIEDGASLTRAAVLGLVDDGVAGFQAVIDAVPGQVEAQVTPLVADAIAADNTIVTAAGTAAQTAVAGALTSAGVVYGGGALPPTEDIAFSIVDSAGRRSWLEVASSGHPTANTIAILTAALQAAIDARATVISGTKQIPEGNGYAYVITDSADRIAFGVKFDGTVTVGKIALPSRSVTSDNLTTEAIAALKGADFSSINEALTYAYAITDSAGRIAFGIGTDGSVRIPKMQLGAGVVTMNNLAPDVAQGLANQRPTYYASVAGVAPGRQIVLTNTLTATQRKVTTTGDNYDPIITGDGYVLFKNSDGLDYAAPVVGGPVVPLMSIKSKMTLWGDSLTAAGRIRTRLLELMPGTTITNEGIGGQTSPQIAARQGGGNSAVTLTGNQIPSSGPVTCTDVPVKFLYGFGINGSEPAISRAGTLAGVPGIMSKAAVPEQGTPVYVFTRTTAGDPVGVPPGTEFILDSSVPAREQIVTLWSGRNNSGTDVEGDTDKMVAHLTPYVKRFLIISTTTSTIEVEGTSGYTRIKAINDYLRAKYGDLFLDVRQHLTDNGLALAGITPTQADLDAMAGDTIPPSLMNPNDSVHFNDAGQTLIANYIYDRMVSKGWI
jgi:lysophospholipase L1-like esterase